MIHGTKEYLEVVLTCDVSLNTQPVEISFDGLTWTAADWIGDPGLTRTARILLDTNTLEPRSEYGVYARITDDPEVPIIYAGDLDVT